ncbi:MAG TPA: NAD(P)-dependent oxidoreductase [Anaerolineae bacterium]|nr:NAD(P)-dependent oxidoreductase [Anaerolineae bacterium]
MKIAVTGGSGELGSNLIPYLLHQGHSVVNIDIVGDSSANKQSTLEHRTADVRDYDQFLNSLRGCDALIHLAAHRSPHFHPAHVVYNDNTTSSYNALRAAATLGIRRVCLASSVNAIGGPYSQRPHYDYFPLDEQHPCYAEDPYSLSKWVLEQQGAAFARLYTDMSIASLRFHLLIENYARAVEWTAAAENRDESIRHLWAYTSYLDACRACLLALTVDFVGHEALFIVAPRTAVFESSRALAQKYYPDTELRSELPDQASFYDCRRAEQVLGWRHEG